MGAARLRRAEALQRQGLTLREIALRLEIGRREVIALLYGRGAVWTPRREDSEQGEPDHGAATEAGAGAGRTDAIPLGVEPQPAAPPAEVEPRVEPEIELQVEPQGEPEPVEPERPAPAAALPEPAAAAPDATAAGAEPLYRLTGRGLWLERNGSGLSDRLDKAWTGTAAQADAIRARYPRYAGLELDPVA